MLNNQCINCCFMVILEGILKKGIFTLYVKVLLADFFGEKIKKEYGQSVLHVKSAIDERESWRRHSKKICP